MFLVDWDKCTGCGNCIEVCPVQAISMQSEKAVIDTDKCAECGVCVDECPNDAICERELELVIEEKAADKEINMVPERKNLLDEQVLEESLRARGDVSAGRQDTFLSVSRNQPRRSVGNGKGRCNRGGRRGRRIQPSTFELVPMEEVFYMNDKQKGAVVGKSRRPRSIRR